MFDAALREEFIARGTSWAAARSALIHDSGYSIPPRVVERFAPFFDGTTLRRIRIVPVPSIPSPGFLARLSRRGAPAPFDFGAMAGVTLVDTVLVSTAHADLAEGAFERLLFHEAVHVVQYQVLGVSRFVREYLVGWARAGFSYEGIPLERQAYALDARFARGEPPFSVEREVTMRFDSKPGVSESA